MVINLLFFTFFFPDAYTKSSIVWILLANWSLNAPESRISPQCLSSSDQPLLNHDANTAEEKCINNYLLRWHWLFALQLSGFIVMKKISFSNFHDFHKYLFIPTPATHSPWKPISFYPCIHVLMYSHILVSWYSHIYVPSCPCIHASLYPHTLLFMYSCILVSMYTPIHIS